MVGFIQISGRVVQEGDMTHSSETKGNSMFLSTLTYKVMVSSDKVDGLQEYCFCCSMPKAMS